MPSPSSGPSVSSQTNITASNCTQTNSSDSTPTQRLWDLRWFPILAAPLVFATIILPLIIGPLVRWLAQTWTKLPRFLTSVIGSVFTLSSIFYVFYLVYTADRPISQIVCDGFALAIGVLHLLHAGITKERRVIWSVYVAFALACLLIDLLVPKPLLMGIAAWSALLLMFLHIYGYLRRYWRGFLKLVRYQHV